MLCRRPRGPRRHGQGGRAHAHTCRLALSSSVLIPISPRPGNEPSELRQVRAERGTPSGGGSGAAGGGAGRQGPSADRTQTSPQGRVTAAPPLSGAEALSPSQGAGQATAVSTTQPVGIGLPPHGAFVRVTGSPGYPGPWPPSSMVVHTARVSACDPQEAAVLTSAQTQPQP